MRTWSEQRDRPVLLLDGNAQRAQLTAQAALLVLAWLLDSWVVVLVAGVMLGAGALRWPQWAVVVRLHERYVAPRLPAVPPVDGRPPRFSAATGSLMFLGLGGAPAVTDDGLLWGAVLVTAGLLVAEVVVGRCVPCESFVWATRHRLIRLRTPVVGREGAAVDAALPPGAVLFTAPFCHRCTTLRDLLHIAAPSISVAERDVTRHPDLVRELDVRTAPTLLLVDDTGDVVVRFDGVPSTDALAAALRSFS